MVLWLPAGCDLLLWPNKYADTSVILELNIKKQPMQSFESKISNVLYIAIWMSSLLHVQKAKIFDYVMYVFLAIKLSELSFFFVMHLLKTTFSFLYYLRQGQVDENARLILGCLYLYGTDKGTHGHWERLLLQKTNVSSTYLSKEFQITNVSWRCLISLWHPLLLGTD